MGLCPDPFRDVGNYWKMVTKDTDWKRPFEISTEGAWRLEAENMPSGHTAHGGAFAHCVWHCLYKRRAGGMLSRAAVALHNFIFENPDGPCGDFTDESSPSDRIANQAGADAADGPGSCVEECKKRYPPK
jgi:hypothetical protein